MIIIISILALFLTTSSECYIDSTGDENEGMLTDQQYQALSPGEKEKYDVWLDKYLDEYRAEQERKEKEKEQAIEAAVEVELEEAFEEEEKLIPKEPITLKLLKVPMPGIVLEAQCRGPLLLFYLSGFVVLYFFTSPHVFISIAEYQIMFAL